MMNESIRKGIWRAALLAPLGGAIVGAIFAFGSSVGSGYEIWLTSGGVLTGFVTGAIAFGAGLGVALIAKHAPRWLRSGLALAVAALTGRAVVVVVLSETRSMQPWQWAGGAGVVIIIIAGVVAVLFERECERSRRVSL